MPNDTFLKILKKGPLIISQARTVTKYLASVLLNLHQQEIAHCDIKPENILVAQNYSLKLCDFGFSRISSQEQGAPGGTPGYTAPEMYFQPMLNLKKCDIFALGVVIFIIVMGFPPFQNNDPQARDTWWNLILTKQWDMFWQKCENFRQTKYPNDFKHVIMNMLECDFNKRLSLEDLLKSEFVQGESASDEEVLMEIKKRI